MKRYSGLNERLLQKGQRRGRCRPSRSPSPRSLNRRLLQKEQRPADQARLARRADHSSMKGCSRRSSDSPSEKGPLNWQFQARARAPPSIPTKWTTIWASLLNSPLGAATKASERHAGSASSQRARTYKISTSLSVMSRSRPRKLNLDSLSSDTLPRSQNSTESSLGSIISLM